MLHGKNFNGYYWKDVINITQPASIIIGQADWTIAGKSLLLKEVAAQQGNYPQQGKWLKGQIRNFSLVELEVGTYSAYPGTRCI